MSIPVCAQRSAEAEAFAEQMAAYIEEKGFEVVAIRGMCAHDYILDGPVFRADVVFTHGDELRQFCVQPELGRGFGKAEMVGFQMEVDNEILGEA